METEQESLLQCEPCLLKNENEHAKYYCKDCDENYCERCMAGHKTQKLFKNHEGLTIADVLPSSDHCEPCYEKQQDVYPVSKCEECEEYFCKTCTIMHNSQKQNKGHTIKQLPRPLSCDPCSSNDTEKVATAYCLECEDPEPMCNECSDQHKRMKKTKNHKMSKNKLTLNLKFSVTEKTQDNIQNGSYVSENQIQGIGEQEQESDTMQQCEPCLGKNKNEYAKYYCTDCVEYYCEHCVAGHRAQKSFKNHNVLTIQDILPVIDHCEPCFEKKKNVHPVNRCEDCNEYLCESCTTVHCSQRQNKGHAINALPRSLLCDPCAANNTNTTATAFCLDCEDPEPLCDDCVIQHKLMKKTKNHKINKDKFTLFLKFNPKEEKMGSAIHNKSKTDAQIPDTNIQVKDIELQCEPCGNRGKPKSAKYFCNDCKERYCKTCMNKHMISKNTKDHRINNVPQDEHYIDNCDHCKYIDIISFANYICNNCKENLCVDCTKIHNSQSISRDHRIQVISERIVYVPCAICCELGEESQATCYCLNCEIPEPLCLSCADEHNSMKRNKNHQLSMEVCKFIKRKDEDVSITDLSIKQNKKEQELNQENHRDVKDHLVEDKVQTPDKPYVTEEENKSDHIILKWEHKVDLGVDDFYQIVMKQYPHGKWNVFPKPIPYICRFVKIDGLKAMTSYVFKVRVANVEMGKEGSFSPESDVVTTGESPAFKIMKRSEQIENGIPAVYRLPIQEIPRARNSISQTRKFILGKPENNTKEKTIMIVGATGSGKSTLINGMANYVMGVTWEDPFRFTLIHLENCELERYGDEALSHTEWITCYTIYSNVASRIDYTINFIDTPGFGDIRGLKQDTKIVSQIRDLFTAKDSKGVSTLDAVCFILKAPDARLTTTQKYIFESILALFGNDIKNNICTLVTFADGEKPPVLAALAALNDKPLPYETYFEFNNSALFANNRTDSKSNLSPFFWEMGMKSCRDFFQSLFSFQTKSLLLTSEVLKKRLKLENTIKHLQEEIDLGLSKINHLEQQVVIFTKYKQEIHDNENFEFEVEEIKMEKIDISGQGIYTTNCLTCNFTCHDSCVYANDSELANCPAMGTDGNCTVCPKYCSWKQHSNVPYVFKLYTQKVKQTNSEMKDKYQRANQKKMSQEEVLEEMHEDIKILEVGIQFKVEEITEYGNSLKEIALRPDPLSTVQYIEQMIESEMQEKKSGFNHRVELLQQCKKRAEIGKTCQIFKHRLRDTRASMKASNASDKNKRSYKVDNNMFKKVKEKVKQIKFG
ncbi:uncharacterized protein LOC143055447 [Mytilus galloprovincialis]|uniref:uncharacterized protein LOC143055447 n=1 Tax=Mytilus galloprovincialis TaxID=29158 RepID=UPI003F7B71FF